MSRLGSQRGLTVTEITDLMLQSGAFTTTDFGKLVETGLLEKSTSQQDPRRVRLAEDERKSEPALSRSSDSSTTFSSAA